MTEPAFRNHPNLEMVPHSSLKPNPNNPRTHDQKQLAKLKASIERFGFLVPIVCDDVGLIVAGAGRHTAAGLLGMNEVPVIRVKFVTEADRRAFALAENRLSELGGWDRELLSAELGMLFNENYDLGITGFDLSELDFGMPKDASEEPPIAFADPGDSAVSRPGDLWLIGQHRLYCGNARDPASYEVLLDGELASLVFGDPPYNLPASTISGLGDVKHRNFPEAFGEMSVAEFTAFLRSIFRNCARFSVDGSIHYLCMDFRHLREMLDAADGVYTELKQLVVWKKGQAGMGAFYRSQHELIFVYKAGKAPHTNTFGLGEKGRFRTNVWEYPAATVADRASHPTIKNLALVSDAILDCSNRNELILDPFSGSGQTLIAAHRTKRRGAAIELYPPFVDLGLRRLSAATGIAPIHIDGRSFDEIAAERASDVDHG